MDSFSQPCTSELPAEKEVRREMLSESGNRVEVPEITRFDANQITPVSATSMACQPGHKLAH